MISLLTLLACSGEPATHPPADEHPPPIASTHGDPVADSVHDDMPEAPVASAVSEHEPPAHEPPAEVAHEAAGPVVPVPVVSTPNAPSEPVEVIPEPPVEKRISARVLLRPILLILPVLLGIRLLGARLRRQIPHLRSALFLAELGLLSAALLWVGIRLLTLLQSVVMTRPGVVVLGLLGVAVLPVVFRLSGHVRGLWLIASGTLRVGDAIENGTISGTIHRIGFLQLTLKGAEGEPIIARYDALSAAPVRITSRQTHVPIAVWVAAPTSVEALRQAALLSPYRQAGSPVQVVVDPGRGQAQVRMVLWSRTVAAEAEALLHRAVG